MRCLMKVTVPVEAGNRAITDGSLPRVIQATIERIKPEAVYFGTENGKRTSYMFFDLADVSQTPVIAEPLFTGLGAEVQFTPVMNAQDLQAGLATLQASR